MADLIPWVLAFGLLAYYLTHKDEVREKFWKWITEKSPYFLVATDVSLTSKGMKKYINQALAKKVLELEAKVAQLEEKVHEYESKIQAYVEAEAQKKQWMEDRIKEITSENVLLRPNKEVKVFTTDYKFVGYLECIAGHFDEAYVIVRTPDNERKIYGPAKLQELFVNDKTLGEQIDQGMLVIAYDSSGRKVSPAYLRVEV